MNKCEKNNKRSLIELFKIYTCDRCIYSLEDEIIKIGYNNIKVYYLNNECMLEDEKYYYKDSKRKKLIFKDIIISNIKKEKNIFLWLNRNDSFENYFYEFDFFLNNGYNIIIII